MSEKQKTDLKAYDERNEIHSPKWYQGFAGFGWHLRDRHRRPAVLGGVAIGANKG
jgi:hypothetical protein